MPLKDCPFVDREIAEVYGEKKNAGNTGFDQDFQKTLSQLKVKIKQITLQERADSLGGKFVNNRITLKILGKDFSIDANGEIFTLLHVNQWLTILVFQYILQGKGLPLTHTWVPFRELETSQDWARFLNTNVLPC